MRDTMINPAIIRAALIHAEATSAANAARTLNVSRKAIYTWRRRREMLGPQWPTDQDIADWRTKAAALAELRRSKRKHTRLYRLRKHYQLGRLKIDATGTTRRMQGLCALGYTAIELGERLGVHKSRVGQLTNAMWPLVHIDTAEQVAALYDELSMTRPAGWMADKIRRHAAGKGWVVPLAWDDDAIDDPNAQPVGLTGRYIVGDYIDEAAVLRRMAGERVNLTKAERIEVVRRLRAAQWTFNQIEEHTGLKTDRYIAREKAAA